jgi:hypothetical protein
MMQMLIMVITNSVAGQKQKNSKILIAHLLSLLAKPFFQNYGQM